MGRAPCCEKDNVKRGPWTPEEDAKLLACIAQNGTGSWRTLPKKAGLQRCGKSCRLRWTNYLRPDLKHGRFSDHEEQLIVRLHAALGSRWSLIAAQLPGRTDNDVKNYWNTQLKKKLCEMGIDPITHKPISQLLADLAGSISLPKGPGHIADATLGCFKNDMLNLLMRQRPDQWQSEKTSRPAFQLERTHQQWGNATNNIAGQEHPKGKDKLYSKPMQMDPIMQKMSSDLSKAMHCKLTQPINPKSYMREHVTRPSDFVQIEDQLFVNTSCNSGEEGIAKSEMGILFDHLNAVGTSCSKPTQWTADAPPEGVVNIPSIVSELQVALTQSQHHMSFSFSQQNQYDVPSGPNHSHSVSQPPDQLDHVVQYPQHQLADQSSANYYQIGHDLQHSTHDAILEATADLAWSPSGSNSTCSSSTVGAQCDLSAAVEAVLSSDMNILWDFSELGSIMS
ncbi:hypothetical protein O6H91_10G069200 [Diphasiastrum complanatum]|uniref:Uncharacterized protein n=1 Tax=Diphasiastrum complanatum TaxID=34168 RepID=A0ACC2CI80_DIPCM|nr:hypothetical protein O6H91_10G069200 [Diphasiastrum complanatum]